MLPPYVSMAVGFMAIQSAESAVLYSSHLKEVISIFWKPALQRNQAKKKKEK